MLDERQDVRCIIVLLTVYYSKSITCILNSFVWLKKKVRFRSLQRK